MAISEALPDTLLEKHYRRVPRYTSYPPASLFTDSFGPWEHRAALAAVGERGRPISLYVHLPFCEKLCLYCGCNVVVTRHKERADAYLDWVEQEAQIVSLALGTRLKAASLHLGGGSPNFLTEPQLDRLMGILDRHFDRGSDCVQSLEVFPAKTTAEFLDRAKHHGFHRISLGVQDMNADVLAIVGRASEGPAVRQVTQQARALEFSSVNYDLMYGLPGQTPESFAKAIEQVVALNPDRIALFGYAHVPHLRRHQRALPEDRMPGPKERAALLMTARSKLMGAGYRAIGLDHYAKPEDDLVRALDDGTLHRNFQGYSADPPTDLVALGESAISSLQNAYAQNHTDAKEYAAAVSDGRLPTARGLVLSADEILRRDVVMEIMVRGSLRFSDVESRISVPFWQYFQDAKPEIEGLEQDGLVKVDDEGLAATELGMVLLRNVASVFDNSAARGQGSFSF